MTKKIFTLAEFTPFEDHRLGFIPRLQVLRDHGILEFLGRGLYRVA
jgi:hypothetical protein